MTQKVHFLTTIARWFENEPDEASLIYYETILVEKFAHVNDRIEEVKNAKKNKKSS